MVTMTYLFLTLCLCLFGWWLNKSTLPARLAISRQFLMGIFAFKWLIGMLYLWIHKYYFQKSDTLHYLQEATLIGETFLEHPAYYIYSLLGWSVDLPDATVFTYPSSYLFWKDLGTYVLVHWHGFLHLFTGGSYLLHLFFITLIGWAASINFYRVFQSILSLHKHILLLCCFFLPSLSFWTAGFHKDVYVYYGLSVFVLGLLEWQKKNSWQVYGKLVLGILVIGLMRYYLLALLLPAAVAYKVHCHSQRAIWSYASVYVCSVLLGILLCEGLLGKSVFELLSQRQLMFLAEKGGSSIPDVVPFEATFWGVLSTLPMAVLNILGRPFLWDCNDVLQLMASLEILSFVVLLIFALSCKKPAAQATNPLLFFLLAYTVSNLVLVGLLVYNIGTLVRYRAISLGILSTLLTHILDVPSRSGNRPQKQPAGQHHPTPPFYTRNTSNSSISATKKNVNLAP